MPTQTASSQASKDPSKVLADAERQWLYTEDELDRAPSCVAGMPPEEERLMRHKGVNFIIQVGVMLKLPQTTISTASVFLNRFLMRHSLISSKKDGYTALHHYQIAAVAIFLGTKVEEHPRKLKEIVIACCRVAQKNPVLIVDEQTKDYWRWKDTITQHEDVMLELLCFDLTIESPYKILYEIMKVQGVVHHKILRDAAWSFLNDSGMTQLCLLFPTRTIACAAFYCGAKVGGIQFDDEKNGRPWWERHGVSGRDLRRAYNHMAVAFRDATLKPGQVSIYVGGLEDLDEDERFPKTRTQREHTTASPEPKVLDGGSQSPKKRPREEDVNEEDDDRPLENGKIVATAKSPGLPSRIPAAARAATIDDRSSKRIKTEEPEDAMLVKEEVSNGRQQVSPAVSEDGEVEE